jgi:hypothetical protein
MNDIVDILSREIHMESARIAPQTSGLIEAAKLAIEEIERLRRQVSGGLAEAGHSQTPH